MEWFEALILGLLQGLTEYLPVSSSGHLAIGSALFGIQGEDGYGTQYFGYIMERNKLDIPRLVQV
jgi:undecaprenyl pyrophosphate phosphatase UppP